MSIVRKTVHGDQAVRFVDPGLPTALDLTELGLSRTDFVVAGVPGPGVPGALVTLTETFAVADFTDGAGASGFVDFDGEIPAGSLVLGWAASTSTAFIGNTSAVIQVGVDGDVDRFSADTTGSVFTAGDVGSLAIAADSAKGIGAAVTPRVTVTGGADFGDISAGVVTVGVTYLAIVGQRLAVWGQ